jgi:hypothetical protein
MVCIVTHRKGSNIPMLTSNEILDHVKNCFGYLVNDYGFSVNEKWNTEQSVEFEKDQVVIRVTRYWDSIVLVYIGFMDPSSHSIRTSYDLNNIVWFQLYKQGGASLQTQTMDRIYSYRNNGLKQAVLHMSRLLRQYGEPFLKGDYSMEKDLASFEQWLMENEVT